MNQTFGGMTQESSNIPREEAPSAGPRISMGDLPQESIFNMGVSLDQHLFFVPNFLNGSIPIVSLF